MEERLWNVEGIELNAADRALLERLWYAFDPLPKVKGMEDSRQYVARMADKISILSVPAQSAFLRDVLRYFEQLPADSPSWLIVSRWIQAAIKEQLKTLEGISFTGKQWCLYYYYMAITNEMPLPGNGTKEDAYTHIAEKTGFSRDYIRKIYQQIDVAANRNKKSCLKDLEKIRPLFLDGEALQELEKQIKAIQSSDK